MLPKAIETNTFNRKFVRLSDVLRPRVTKTTIRALEGHKNPYYHSCIHCALKSSAPQALGQ